jgi:hypothetical protein
MCTNPMHCKSYKRSFMNMAVEKCDLFVNTFMSYFRKTSRRKVGGFSVNNQLRTETNLITIYGQR